MLPGILTDVVSRALAEDVRSGDVTSRFVIEEAWEARALIKGKQAGIFAGGALIGATYDVLAEDQVYVEVVKRDGESIRSGQTIAEISGPAHVVLAGERTLLNFMQRMSGIATLTSKYVSAVKGTNAKIADTRKTTPGLRVLEKHAVVCGGGINHRFALDDCVLIKDNHISLFQLHHSVERPEAVAGCIAAARSKAGHTIRIETEAADFAEATAAVEAGTDILMLDNWSLDELRTGVRKLKKAAPDVTLEASGGVTLRTVGDIAKTGVDVISVGALTHSPPALDIAMDIL